MTGWPPTGPPRPDDWWPPELWTPKGYPVAIAMEFMGHPMTMAATWCRATLPEAHRYYQAAVRADWTNWAIERDEAWSPGQSGLRRSMEELWIRGCRLAMAADQAQTGVRPVDPGTAQIPNLRTVRNVIAHLEGAAFDEDFTIATADHEGRKAWSLPVLVGTASYTAELGYAIPPRTWHITAPMDLGDGRHVVTPALELTIAD